MQTNAERAMSMRRVELVRAFMGDVANDAAWSAWLADVPMSWLPTAHYGVAR